MQSEYLKKHTPTGNIAAILPLDRGIIELSFFQTCVMGICESAEINDYEVLLCYSDYRDLRHIRSLVEQHKIDGVVVTRTNNPDMTVEYLTVAGVPLVTVGSYPDPSVIQVDHNHEEACKDLTQMFLMKGRRHIAFLGNQEQSVVTQRRYNGYCEALRATDAKLDPRLIRQDIETQIQMDRVVADLLALKVDAIVCTDEVLCYWAYASLKNRDVSVPKDVELASCYHSNALEDYIPSITTIKYDSKQLGVIAADTLFNIIGNRAVPKRQYLSYEFNIKKSNFY